MKTAMTRFLIAVVVLCSLSGCDYPYQEMRRKDFEKRKQALQALGENRDREAPHKCFVDAEAYFRRERTPDPGAMLLLHSPHYNEARNTCFVTVVHHYTAPDGSWFQTQLVYDVWQDEKRAEYRANHEGTTTTLLGCEVYGLSCRDYQEFESLVGRFISQ